MIRLSMIVRNEERRYLRPVLESARGYIDDAVIIDDDSTDNTVALCREMLEGIPNKIIINMESRFHSEWVIRRQQWNETIKDNPDWIIFLDADEIFEKSFTEGVRELTRAEGLYAYSFRLYDFWDENHYRDDSLWCAHTGYRPFMLKYKNDFAYEFKETDQHCGRMPSNIFSLPNGLSEFRVKHYGWAREEDRIAKYSRYMSLDPYGKYGSLAQYRSILDPNPNLIEWRE